MSSSIIETLTQSLGTEKVLTDAANLNERRHDYWVVSHLNNVHETPTPPPACVARPASTEDVVAILNACTATGTPVIPFGLGSGVCGGVVASSESVMLDLSGMTQTHSIDETNLLATFDAGKNGMEAEEEVQKLGLTIGHWPQSIAVSSVGGWIATRASGQFSTGYGNIEDIVHSYEVVLPNGQILQVGKSPRAAAGPDLRHLFMGSEGTLGVITRVTFKLRRLPETILHTAFYADNMAQGIDAQRVIIQSGYTPVVMRQYDTTECQRVFPEQAKDDKVIFFCIHEGPKAMVEAEVAGVKDIAATAGLEPAPVELVEQWFSHRNTVPSWESFLSNGIVLDTIEISSAWDTIDAIYDEATASLKEVPGVLAASAHSSHVYRNGINLYFTFAARPENKEDMESTYFECWKRVLETTAKHGGGIAHHHGIGRVRKDYLHHDLGETGVQALRDLKRTFDPDGIMNPGVQIPDA